MKKNFSEDDAVVGDEKGEKIARGSGRGLGRNFYPLPHLPSRCPITSHIAFCPSSRLYLWPSSLPIEYAYKEGIADISIGYNNPAAYN